MRRTSKHHRRPRSKGGTNDDRNVSKVTPKEHEAWHTLFQNMDAVDIANRINAVWLDPAFEFLCLRRGK